MNTKNIENHTTAIVGIILGLLVFVFSNLILFEFKNTNLKIVGISTALIILIVTLIYQGSWLQQSFLNDIVTNMTSSSINLRFFYIGVSLLIFIQLIHLFILQKKQYKQIQKSTV